MWIAKRSWMKIVVIYVYTNSKQVLVGFLVWLRSGRGLKSLKLQRKWRTWEDWKKWSKKHLFFFFFLRVLMLQFKPGCRKQPKSGKCRKKYKYSFLAKKSADLSSNSTAVVSLVTWPWSWVVTELLLLSWCTVGHVICSILIFLLIWVTCEIYTRRNAVLLWGVIGISAHDHSEQQDSHA